MNKTITNRKAYHKLGRGTESETFDLNVKETKLKFIRQQEEKVYALQG